MRKYKVSSRIIHKERAEYWDDVPFLPALSVYEQDNHIRDTGLVNEHGLTIYSINEKRPIGFISPSPNEGN